MKAYRHYDSKSVITEEELLYEFVKSIDMLKEYDLFKKALTMSKEEIEAEPEEDDDKNTSTI